MLLTTNTNKITIIGTLNKKRIVMTSSTFYLPAPNLTLGSIFSGCVQDACQTGSIPATAWRGIARFVGIFFPFIPDLSSILCRPSVWLEKGCEKKPNLLNKISWIAPAAGIVLATGASYALFNFAASTFLKGLTCGFHSSILGALSAPEEKKWEKYPINSELTPKKEDPELKIISLKQVLSQWIGLKNSSSKVTATAEKCALVALVTTSVGLTLLGHHLIIATAAAWIASTAVEVLALKRLAAAAPPHNQEN
jgi:hypothetical protein